MRAHTSSMRNKNEKKNGPREAAAGKKKREIKCNKSTQVLNTSKYVSPDPS